jgi:hypothetical protein
VFVQSRLVLGTIVTSKIWEMVEWVLDNPTWSASVMAAVVLCVVFALPDSRRQK